ncbi:hypothetical protein AMAG_13361 [Allomyces macrogynus ATCC 38327]|uniref:HTH APSES-type domain-containing protein n=1 Tax=Allomyces macrogynus (strain ATCC 38327) TaxID=578462 RepID=A0A0L0T255_ALLM3|nr:hypothetical protein AMAG_13361 [Allomyces macrogynus ATCC 38327]|eukprot:KNE68720.1 hypothetical protein AMAG_13361 [Allomyces macrogynus ATCC 38327]
MAAAPSSAASSSSNGARPPPAPLPGVYAATYSAIPVWQMRVAGVDVMRRASDNWLNATQLLKVAAVDKPQRTKILEREIQTGEHEKVQGGYGKYQGTWVPFARGVEIAKQFKVEHLVQALLDYAPSSDPPPPAAPRGRPSHGGTGSASNASPLRAVKRARREPAATAAPATRPADNGDDDGDDDDLASDSDSDTSAPPARGTPIRAARRAPAARSTNARRASPTIVDVHLPRRDELIQGLLDRHVVPRLLQDPPADLPLDLPLDDHGHSTLHWAAALARLDCVALLLAAGLDASLRAPDGSTPLMWAVRFDDNLTQTSLLQLIDLLGHDTLPLADHAGRTVLHHLVLTAPEDDKLPTVQAYLAQLVDAHLVPPTLANAQDANGDTPLHIATRNKHASLAHLLIQAGAKPGIRNKAGERAAPARVPAASGARKRRRSTLLPAMDLLSSDDDDGADDNGDEDMDEADHYHGAAALAPGGPRHVPSPLATVATQTATVQAKPPPTTPRAAAAATAPASPSATAANPNQLYVAHVMGKLHETQALLESLQAMDPAHTPPATLAAAWSELVAATHQKLVHHVTALFDASHPTPPAVPGLDATALDAVAAAPSPTAALAAVQKQPIPATAVLDKYRALVAKCSGVPEHAVDAILDDLVAVTAPPAGAASSANGSDAAEQCNEQKNEQVVDLDGGGGVSGDDPMAVDLDDAVPAKRDEGMGASPAPAPISMSLA